MLFGKFVKEKRISLDLSLREFCKKIEEDPSNWSKIERGILNPPREKEKLEKIAVVLKFSSGSADWDKLHDLAAISAGSIPEYIMSDEAALKLLPAFFRTVKNVKPTESEIKELIEQIKKEGYE